MTIWEKSWNNRLTRSIPLFIAIVSLSKAVRLVRPVGLGAVPCFLFVLGGLCLGIYDVLLTNKKGE